MLRVELRLLAVLGELIELKSCLLGVVITGEVEGISEGLLLDRDKGTSGVVMLGTVISEGFILDKDNGGRDVLVVGREHGISEGFVKESLGCFSLP